MRSYLALLAVVTLSSCTSSPAKHSLTVAITGSGSVTSSPGAINCGAACTDKFDDGAAVVLTATPASGWTFSGWAGGCSGTAATCQVTMTGDIAVVATFASAVQRQLTVSVDGPGGVSSSPAGIDCGNDCAGTFGDGQVVTLTATPGAGAQFKQWSGACSGTQLTCLVTMSADLTAHAQFATSGPAPTFSLGVSVTGSGSVTSSPAGIDCGTHCSGTFASGTAVTLTAAAASGWNFIGWSGACSGSQAACTVTMDANKSVGATFQAAGGTDRTLSVVVAGSGTVSSNPSGISCPGTCGATWANGTGVTLTATAASGWTFDGWGGACSGAGGCAVTMDANKTVYATFREVPPPPADRTLSVVVTGSGTVSSSPPGISCPGTCGATLANGTGVTLTATAASGWTFDGWGGACSGAGSCAVTMDADKTVYATFREVPHPPVFTVTVIGNGHVAVGVDPPDGVIRICWGPATCNWQITPGTMLSLSASPDPGWDLLDWGGGCDPVVGYFCQGPMPNYDQGVSVTFAQKRKFSVTVMGVGRVVSAPAGIDCPFVTCSGYFLAGSTITLTATPLGPNSTVTWDPAGGCSPFGHEHVCTGPVPDFDYSVGVTFTP